MWKRMLRTTSPRRRGEGFNTNHREGRVLTKAHLKRCAAERDARRVKPSHLSPEDKRDHLNTPEKFMRAAREFGYGSSSPSTARTRSRAWSVVGDEAAVRRTQGPVLPARGDLVRGMDEEYFLWQRGLRAAIHERLKVIELSFENVTRGLCAP
ncbi:hypothetical protein JL720_13237 [Aureococcus anophagefferens]|nr:hypothetical protein JL720_13237 [Aureococcus anophagefferens]